MLLSSYVVVGDPRIVSGHHRLMLYPRYTGSTARTL
jgi:hypothetical protein